MSECFDKTPYPNRRAAEEVRRQRSRRRTFDSRLHAFHCPRCGNWHLGRDTTKKRSKFPARHGGTFHRSDGESWPAGFETQPRPRGAEGE